MEIRCQRHEGFLLHLPAAGALDRRLISMSECAFDGHVVLSLASWRYSAAEMQVADDWSFTHLASGGFDARVRARIEAALHSVPEAAPVAQVTPLASFDRADGEWLVQWLWSRFRQPSIVWLNVPYASRDQAKRLGARWSPQAHRWYGVRSQDFDQGLSAWAGRRKH